MSEGEILLTRASWTDLALANATLLVQRLKKSARSRAVNVPRGYWSYGASFCSTHKIHEHAKYN